MTAPADTNRARRRLAAIVAVDVVGYSRLIGLDEEGTLARLKTLRRELVDPKLNAHAGHVFKTMGDGLLIEFASAVDAVRCMIELQGALAEREAALPADRRLALRVGINVGDVVVDGEDRLGDGVNIAARLEQLAEPGGLCLSARALEDVRGRVKLASEDLGPQQLKNIAQPVHAFRVSAGGAPPHQTEPAAPALALPDKPSIAVLPFQNMSGDPDQDYFADGVGEDIITELTRFRSLFVIARNSSFSYKGKSPDVRDVGRELGVRYVMVGSVRKAGDRVRLTGQLIDTRTGSNIWAERYDRQLDDVFGVQEELTRSIVRAIAPQISEYELAQVRRRRPENLGAYEIAVRAHATAWDAFARADPALCDEALDLARRALAIDPDSTMALAARALAQTQHLWRMTAHDRVAVWRDAKGAMERLIELEPYSSIGYIWKGHLHILDPDGSRLADALAAAHQALDLNPHDMTTLIGSTFIEGMAGDPQRAIALGQEALRLSPRDPLRPYMRQQIAIACFEAGRHDEAIEQARLGLADAPNLPPLHVYLAASHAALGQLEPARAAFNAARKAGPDYVAGVLAGTTVIANWPSGLKDLLRLAAGAEAEQLAGLPLPDKPSIAVLPFQNMSGDPEQEYFADGMVEEIITALSRNKQLFVIARNSSFAYKGTSPDIRQVGRELGVRYVLEGSVRKSANRVRIAGQLIEASTGAHIWAERFDGDLEDIFELQDQIASSVIAGMAKSLEFVELERAKRKTGNLQAYDYYLRSRATHYRNTKEDSAEALALARKAVALDPDFALGHAMIAVSIDQRISFGWVVDAAGEREEAEHAVRRALELDSQDARVLVFCGIALQNVLRRTEEAAAHLAEAVKIDPNYSQGWTYQAAARMALGDPEAAIADLERALRLNPIDRTKWVPLFLMGRAHNYCGRYAEALPLVEAALRLRPNHPGALVDNVVANVLAGHLDAAREALAILRKMRPEIRASTDEMPFLPMFPAFNLKYREALRLAGLPE
jgi:adenylate cyclase